MSARFQELPLPKVYALIEPGPVVMLATAHKGRPNVMTMSWHMMVDFEPPLIACVVSSANYSFAALKATRECVIAIPARASPTRWWRWATAQAPTPTSLQPSA